MLCCDSKGGECFKKERMNNSDSARSGQMRRFQVSFGFSALSESRLSGCLRWRPGAGVLGGVRRQETSGRQVLIHLALKGRRKGDRGEGLSIFLKWLSHERI